jgi:hypothetical protein
MTNKTDICYKPSGFHDDGEPMLCTLPTDHLARGVDHWHHDMFAWPDWASAPEIEAMMPAVGTRVRFDGKRTSWRVRAHAGRGRYTICTAWFGCHPRTKERQVGYTIIDWHERIRGPLNVIGGGMGIATLDGPDPAIDRTVEMLDEGVEFERTAAIDHCTPCGGWQVSQRNNLPLVITRATA